jgi:multidrug efflux pump subunit AcrA (membrane-fusion protein)
MGIGLDLVRRWRPGRRVSWLIGGGVLTVLIAGTATAYALTGTRSLPGEPVGTALVDRGDVTVAVSAVGTLRPATQRQLSFGTAGAVTDVRVRPGDAVQAGQVLAVLDDAPAKAAVAATEDALSQAETGLTAAQQTLDTPTAPGCAGGSGGGAQVSESPVASRSPTPIPSSTAAASGRPTPRPTGGTGRTPAAGSGPGCGTSGTGAAGRVGSTGSAGSTAGDPVLRAHQQVTSAEMRLAQARDQLAGATITAPVAGKVLSVAGVVGGRVTAGTGFIQLGVVDDMQVAASFPEADAGRISTGLTATVALADRPGEEFPGRVTQVDPAGVSDGQLVRYGVLVAFDKVPADLLVGQSANVVVRVATVAGVLRLPASAVHVSDGTGAVRLNGSAEPRQVVVGVRGDRYTEIRSGLAEADRVLTSW